MAQPYPGYPAPNAPQGPGYGSQTYGYDQPTAPAGGYPPYPGAGGYPPQPQAPADVAPVDTPTYQGDTPPDDVEDNPNATAPPASAPPAAKMGAIEGYSNLTFDTSHVCPPPSYHEAMSERPPEHRPPPNIPVISEEQARDALTEFVAAECCYGKGVLKDMVIRDIQSTSAYHYKLESFCEARSTQWAYEPYRGGSVDSAMNGHAPGPWQIAINVPQNFKNGTTSVPVPHTASIMPCHTCFGMGRTRCFRCMGRGRVRCPHCSGTGRVHHHHHDAHGNHHHNHHHGHGGAHNHGHGGHHHGHHHGGHHFSPCTWCVGTGRKRCMTCHGHGMTTCSTCLAAGQLKCYVKLTVTWTNHGDDSVTDRTNVLPTKLIQEVSGQVALREEYPRVWPVTNFPEPAVNQASNQLVTRHSTQFSNERMLAQRQTIRVIPVTEVTYEYKDKTYKFYVYGFEHKVYHPDYPQKCCCCVIL